MADRPRLAGLLCIAVATAIGILYLLLGGAPVRYIAINLAALFSGSALLLLIKPDRWNTRTSGVVNIAIGILLNLVGLWGKSLYGVRRWFVVGGISFEPSMIFLPFSVLLFAENQNAYSAVGLILVAVATAMQPDRSMAGALCLGLLALLIAERKRSTVLPFAAACGALSVALLRSDTVPPAPFVEKVFLGAFALNWLLGLLVATGAAILLLPALFFGFSGTSSQKGICSAFAGLWIGLFAATVLGNYPTPVVGYGSSAILGYILSVACLPPTMRKDQRLIS